MSLDENTYGFNKADAEDILNGLGNRDQEFSGRIPRDTATTLLGRTGSGGIPLGSASTVTLYNESSGGWTIGSDTVQCWSFPTAIDGVKDVMIFEIGSRLVAMEIC